MRPIAQLEFPDEIAKIYRKARRLEWLTIVYISIAATFLYLTMGNSQAMRASFFEDVISVVPAVAFLIGTAVARRAADPLFPYGKHRATGIAYLTAALALFAMGLFLAIEAVTKVLAAEKATIAGFSLFGSVIWAGWPMLAAVAFTGIPSVFLGRAKLRLAPRIHDKVLFADAQMMKADWMAESATAIGVIGVGFGLWWLDPLAAGIVAADILKDGISNLKAAVADLIERRPQKTDQSDWEPLPDRIHAYLHRLDWVAHAEVRLRDEGHIFMGEAFVVPRAGTQDLVRKISEAAEGAKKLDWRMHELAIMPVENLPDLNSR